MAIDLTNMLHAMSNADSVQVEGRVRALTGLSIRAAIPGVRIGEIVRIERRDGPLLAEVVGFVEDDGLGIHPEDRERVFHLFERAHGAEFDGSGAGLAICRRIIEAHGGRIWVEPNDAGGSTFLFTLGPEGIRLPADPGPSQPGTPTAASSPA